jgi:hypothetical protein
MKNIDINIDYIVKVKNLSEDDRERVLSRMGGKLPKRLQKEKLTVEEAIAIQLELEDEQLQEWRANMAVIQEKAAKAKAKSDEKAAKVKSKASPLKIVKSALAKEAPAKKTTPAATTNGPAKPLATIIPALKK